MTVLCLEKTWDHLVQPYLLRQDQLDNIVWFYVKSSFKHCHRWRFHNIAGQPPMFDHPHSKEVSSSIQIIFFVCVLCFLFCFLICAQCFLFCQWALLRIWLPLLHSFPSGIYTLPPKPSSHQTVQFHLSLPLPFKWKTERTILVVQELDVVYFYLFWEIDWKAFFFPLL